MKHWIIIGLLALSISAVPAVASDYAAASDGVDVLSFFASAGAAGSDEPVLGMAGFYGQPQPPQWLILTPVLSKPGVLRESILSGGEVVAERQFRSLPGQDVPDIPISKEELKFSSRAAFKLGEAEAKRRKVSFKSVHFQLRCQDEQSEPVWMLNLINRAQVSVGVVYISARSGKILRTTWPETKKFSSISGSAQVSNQRQEPVPSEKGPVIATVIPGL